MALAKLAVQLDVNEDLTPQEIETLVSGALAQFALDNGQPGNASVTLQSLDPNASISS